VTPEILSDLITSQNNNINKQPSQVPSDDTEIVKDQRHCIVQHDLPLTETSSSISQAIATSSLDPPVTTTMTTVPP
jgi:hypothetical protein